MLARKFVGVVFLMLSSIAGRDTYAFTTNIGKPLLTDSTKFTKDAGRFFDRRQKLASAADCYNLHWATWPAQNDVNSLTGTIADENGIPMGITMSANYLFGTTPSIYTYSRLNGYPGVAPNTTVPKTTWGAGSGTTTMCFSKKVTNPVLLLSSLGSSLPQSARLDFSMPYVVLYDGGGMVYNSNTALTGTEGYAVIMFPGEFTCVTISSTTPENYTNLTWGLRVQPFEVNITENPNCGSTTLTASGGISYKWDGGSTPNQAVNTFYQSGTYIVTVTNADGCATSVSKAVTVFDGVPSITGFTLPQQIGPAIINNYDKSVEITVPDGTDLSALTPQITTFAATSISPGASTTRDFRLPVVYMLGNVCANVYYSVTVKTQTVPTYINICPDNAIDMTGAALTLPVTSYTWQLQTEGTWVTAPGTADGPNYNTTAPGNLTGHDIIINYRRVVNKNGTPIYDSYYQVTTTPTTAQNIISLDKTVACGTGYVQYNFTGNIPQGFIASSVFEWQRSNDGITWQSALSDAKEWSLAEEITTKTWFRRATVTGNCTSYSNIVTIDYIPGPGDASVGPPVTLCNVSSYTLAGNVPAVDEIGTWSIVTASGYNPFTMANIHEPHAYITGMPLNSDFEFTWTITKTSCDKIKSASVLVKNGVDSKVTGFNIAGQVAPSIINETDHTITLTVSPQVDKTHLTPIINTTDGGTVTPASGVEQNFAGIVNYRLYNTCGFIDYKVTITSLTAAILHACQASTFNILIPGNNISGVFQWQIYIGGIWQDLVSGANNSDYIAAYSGGVVSTTVVQNFRRKVISNAVITYDSYTDVYFEPPISNNQIVSDKQFVCAAGSNMVTLTGNLPTGGSGSIIYQWRSSVDNTTWQNITNATQKDYQFAFNGTSSKYYTRLAKAGSCDDVSNAIKIDYTGLVTVAAAGGDQSGCGVSELTLAANTPKSTEVGTWSVISPANYNPFGSSNVHNPQAVITNLPFDTDIQLKWSITEAGCDQLSESLVTVRSTKTPVVSAGGDVVIDRGASTILNGLVSGGNFLFKWSPSTGLSNPDILNPVASPAETTVYTLIAFNGVYCSTQANVKVIVNNELGIPNSITPNNDGINDDWAIKNIEDQKNVTVQIFDRIGRQVFNSVGYPKKWDATFNGKKLPAAVYYYVIFLKDVKVKKAGWVTVIY